MSNLVVHFEIHASEPDVLIEFYSGLLGWRFTKVEDVAYWLIETGEGATGNLAGTAGHGIDGGLMPREGPRLAIGAPVNGANIVVGVDDVDGLMHRGIELGATEAMAAQDWPGMGRAGYLLDPDGNVFGLFSPILSDGSRAAG